MAKDMESRQSQEEKPRRRMKLAAFIVAFVIFHVIVILVFALVVMRARTPRFRIGNSMTIRSLTAGNQSSPSFVMNFTAPIRIENTNFGPYRYDATAVSFTYGGVQVGQVTVPKSKASFRSTKKVNVTVSVNSEALTARSTSSGLGSELSSGVLTLNGQGRLEGKVELVLVFKKKKSASMNCTVAVHVSSKSVQSLSCK